MAKKEKTMLSEQAMNTGTEQFAEVAKQVEEMTEEERVIFLEGLDDDNMGFSGEECPV